MINYIQVSRRNCRSAAREASVSITSEETEWWVEVMCRGP